MDYIVLMDGRRVDLSALDFNSDTLVFMLGDEDVTNLVKRSDKRRFPGFDDTAENLRIYRASHPGVPETGSTSILSNFTSQILTDPLDAPVQMFGDAAKKALESTGGKVVILVVAIGIGMLILSYVPRRAG